MHATLGKFAAVLFTLSTMAACSNGVPLGPSGAATSPTTNTTTGATRPTTTPVTATPATPTAPTTTAVAYTPDLQPIFQSDCVPCHGAVRGRALLDDDVFRPDRCGASRQCLERAGHCHGSLEA
jgi:hypothetical protein